MTKIDLSIIIVTFKSESTIEKCLDSVYSSFGKINFEVIISDNSPNKNTKDLIEKIKAKYKNLTFIYNDDNEGFSRGNNIALKNASGEYVLFLNPDMVVEKNTISGIMEFMKEHPEAGTATPKVHLLDGTLDDSCHRGFPTPWRAFCHFSKLSKIFPKNKIFAGYNLTYLDFTKTHEIDALAGSFLIIKSTLGKKLNWWDEDYFFYGEDIDFCYRIKKAGYKIYYVPKYQALHYKGVSSGIKKISKDISTADKKTKLWVTEQRFKAMEIFYDKHYKNKYPEVLRMIVLFAIRIKRDIERIKINSN